MISYSSSTPVSSKPFFKMDRTNLKNTSLNLSHNTLPLIRQSCHQIDSNQQQYHSSLALPPHFMGTSHKSQHHYLQQQMSQSQYLITNRLNDSHDSISTRQQLHNSYSGSIHVRSNGLCQENYSELSVNDLHPISTPPSNFYSQKLNNQPYLLPSHSLNNCSSELSHFEQMSDQEQLFSMNKIYPPTFNREREQGLQNMTGLVNIQEDEVDKPYKNYQQDYSNDLQNINRLPQQNSCNYNASQQQQFKLETPLRKSNNYDESAAQNNSQNHTTLKITRSRKTMYNNDCSQTKLFGEATDYYKKQSTSSEFDQNKVYDSSKIEENQSKVNELYANEKSVKDQKRFEAIQRKKYKDKLKKQSQEQHSKGEDEDEQEMEEQMEEQREEQSENSQIDEKSFVQNSIFLKQYRQRLIGRSSNSKIFELKNSGTDVSIGEVVKQVPHKMSNHHQIECCELRNEHSFLKKMDHPHIITLGSNKEFIRDRNFCGIILPQAECNLMQFAKTQRHGKICLSQIRIAFRQIAEAIQYLHDNYISHNDIKPDNIFVFKEGDYRLADFGFAIDLPKPNCFKNNSTLSQTLRKQVKIEDLKKNWKQRCKQYVAPELIKVLNGKRPRTASDEKSCDVFALGVSFFIIIFYQLPFCGSALKTDQRYKHFFKSQFDKFWSQFKSMFIKFHRQENSYPDELKDLFNKILEPNPIHRLNIEQVLEHPWLNH